MTTNSKANLVRLPVVPVTRDIAAKLDGVPPILLLATQISTSRWHNTIAYRSSGKIPTGLYRSYLEGKAAPKDFFLKVKSSNWGVMEGYAVVDDRLGRSQTNKQTGFEIRPHALNDLPRTESGEVTLNKFPLTMALQDIMYDAKKIPPKYKFLEENNPDEKGILRFHQVDHPNSAVNSVIFSINLNDPKAELTPTAGVDLIASKLLKMDKGEWLDPDYAPPGWKEELGNFSDKLTMSYPCFAQFPGNDEAVPIEIYGRKFQTVRDVDKDFTTKPLALEENLTLPLKNGADKYHQLIDMSHGTVTEKFEASKKMIALMFEINQSEWKKYETLKAKKMEERGRSFDETEIADKIPLSPKFRNLNAISKFVITVGLGSPMELYQSMEINIVNQKLMDLRQTNPDINLDNFTHPATKNEALLVLNKQPMTLDQDMLAKCFIQHPDECHNHHYASDRSGSIMVHGNSIALPENDAATIKYLNSTAPEEHVTINPQWISESKTAASVHSEDWVKHYVSHFDAKYDTNPETYKKVISYLENNPEFVKRELSHFMGDKTKLNNFLDTNPKIKELASQFEDKTARFRP